MLEPGLAGEGSAVGPEVAVAVLEVGSHEVVVAIGAGVAVCRDDADLRFLEDVHRDAAYGEVLGPDITVPLLVDAEDPDVEGAFAPGDLPADADVDGLAVVRPPDPAREEGTRVLLEACEVEDQRVLEEEPASLGKEQGKLREVDLAVVYGRLGEVGVGREDARETGRELVEHVQAGIRIGLVPVLSDAIELILPGKCEGGHDVETHTLLDPPHALERPSA